MSGAWALRHPFLPLLLAVLLVIFGVRAALQMPLTHLPDVGENRVIVQLLAQDATLATTDRELARPVEEAVAALTEISRVDSDITAGEIRMTLFLRDSRSSQDTLAKVSDRIRALIPELHIDAELADVRAVSSRRQPVMEFALVPRDGDLVSASAMLQDVIRPDLRKIIGLADIVSRGERRAWLSLRPDPARLLAVGMTLGDFRRQVATALDTAAGGHLHQGAGDGGSPYLLRLSPPGAPDGTGALDALPLSLDDGQVVPMSAVADVVPAAIAGDSTVRSDGSPALLVSLFPDADADLEELMTSIDDRLADLSRALPELEFKVIDRPADRAMSALDATIRALIEGSLLVIVVIGVALRDIRATGLAALALPLSVLPTLFVMQMFGLSLNIVSLLALTLASGILVDDAIVELENIDRQLARKSDVRSSVERAVRRIALPVLATSGAIIAVFLPVALMAGEAGRYFWAFGATLCIATVFSLAVARLVIPPLAARVLTAKGRDRRAVARGRLLRKYRSVLALFLTLRWPVLSLVVLLCALIVAGMLRHPGTFIPEDRTGVLRLDVSLPAVMDNADKLGHLAGLEKELRAHADVHAVSLVLPQEPDQPARLVIDTDGTTTAETKVKETIADYPDLRFSLLQSTGRPRLAFDLGAPDMATLDAALPLFLERLSKQPGIDSIRLGTTGKHPEFRLEPSRQTLLELDLARAQLRDAIESLSQPRRPIVALLEQPGGDALPVRIDIQEGIAGLATTSLRLPSGGLVPLSAVGQFRLDLGQLRLVRRDGQYVLRVVADPSSPADVPAISRAATDAVRSLAAQGHGLTLLQAGDTASRQEMMTALKDTAVNIMVLLGAVLFALFRSAGQVFVIMASMLLSLIGGMLTLKVAGMPISLPVMIGFLLLFGIVAKNAILLVDRSAAAFRRTGDMPRSIILAAQDRARPIVMTSVAMILGMIPAAMPWLDGSAFRQPLAITVIGGVAVSTVLSLVLVPAMSLIVHEVAEWGAKGLKNVSRWRPRQPGNEGAFEQSAPDAGA